MGKGPGCQRHIHAKPDVFVCHGSSRSGDRLIHLQANGLVQKALLDKDAAESDIDCAPRLLDVILQCCKGSVDACLPSYIQLCHQR